MVGVRSNAGKVLTWLQRGPALDVRCAGDGVVLVGHTPWYTCVHCLCCISMIISGRAQKMAVTRKSHRKRSLRRKGHAHTFHADAGGAASPGAVAIGLFCNPAQAGGQHAGTARPRGALSCELSCALAHLAQALQQQLKGKLIKMEYSLSPSADKSGPHFAGCQGCTWKEPALVNKDVKWQSSMRVTNKRTNELFNLPSQLLIDGARHRLSAYEVWLCLGLFKA